MTYRRAALVIGLLAAIAAALGSLPARVTTHDDAYCVFHEAISVPSLRPFHCWGVSCLSREPDEPTLEPPEPGCAERIVARHRSAIDLEAVAALVIVVLGAIVTALVPRRTVALGWIASSAIAAFLAFVMTRSFALWKETVSSWPRPAAWCVVALVAIGLASVLVKTIVVDDEPRGA